MKSYWHWWCKNYNKNKVKKEGKKQILEQEHKLPKAIIACVGGGSNSIGIIINLSGRGDKDMETILNF